LGHSHWQTLRDNAHDDAGDSDTYCTYLGRRDTDGIVSIHVAMPKVAKASQIHVTVTGIIMGVITLTFANGNTA
jgi:hypothetical protein